MSTLICVENIMPNLDSPPLWHYWCNLLSVLVFWAKLVATFFSVFTHPCEQIVSQMLIFVQHNLEKQWGTETCLHCLKQWNSKYIFSCKMQMWSSSTNFQHAYHLLHVLLISSSPSSNLQLWKTNLMTFKNIPYILILLTRC